MHAYQLVGMVTVKLEEYSARCHTCYRRYDTHSHGRIKAHFFSVFLYGAHFYNSPVHLAVMSLANLVGHTREVEVGVFYFVSVNAFSERRISSIRRAEIECLFFGQYSVGALPCRGAGIKVYLERTPCFVFAMGLGGNFGSNGLGNTRRCETSQSYSLSVFYVCCCLGGSNSS